MNWRRGLLLAAVNVGIAAPLLSWQTAQRFATRKTDGQNQTSETLQLPEFQHADSGDTVTVTVGPCDWTYDPPPIERFLTETYLPVSFLTNPLNPCRQGSNLPSILQPGRTYSPRGYPVAVVVGFSILAAIQWSLVGSFPLRRSKHWWGEPGAFITACACSGGIPVLIFATATYLRWIGSEAYWRLPQPLGIWVELMGGLALTAWLWWFALLVWRTLRASWFLLSRRHATPAA